MGTDFRNNRGLNLSDPKYDKDAVNLRTLKREVESIVIGTGSTVGLFEEGSGNNSAVLKDSSSDAGGDFSIVLGGVNNTVATNADYSAIIGGVGNDVFNGVQNSVVVGGINVNASQNNSLYTQNARLAENSGIIYSAGTNLYNIFAPIGSGGGVDVFTNSLSYNSLLNKITLTKSDSSTIDLVINEFEDLTINGDLEVSGVLTSGSTDLYDIFSTDGAALNSLNQGRVFVGSLGNTPQGVDVTGDIAINYSGETIIQSDSVTFDKIQDLNERSVIGTLNQSGGTVEEIPMVDSYSLSASTLSLLDNSVNWSPSGVYTGSTISGTFQGQAYYNANYWFTAVDDDVWIRIARS